MQITYTYRIFIFLTLLFSTLATYSQDLDKNLSDTTAVGQTDTIQNPKDADFKEPVVYSANDSMMFSMPKHKIFLYGESKLNAEDFELTSAHIEMDFNENYVYAEGMADTTGKIFGDPVFKDDNDEFLAKSIKYNFKTKKGLVKDVITEQAEGYLHGETTKMYPNKHVHVKNGKYTTCNHDPPHYYVKLTKAKVIPGEKIISGPLYLVIADVPTPLILPFGYFPNQSQNTSGLLMPTYGEEKRRGFYLKGLGYYWAINDNMNLAATGDYYTYGSWGVNVGSNFRKRYKYNGNLAMSYQRNTESFKGLPDYTDSRSFWVRAAYNQDSKANPYQSFSANLNFGTSNFKELNSTNIDDYTNSSTSSSLSYRRSFPNLPINLSASANATQNTSTKTISISAPTVAVTMNKIYPLKNVVKKNQFLKKLSFNTNVNFNNTLSTGDSTLFTQESVDKMKYGLKYTLPVTSSFTLFDFLTFSPSFNYTGRLYPNYINKRIIPNATNTGDSLVTDTLSQLTHVFDFGTSMGMSTTLYGMFNFKRGPIKALRHVVRPSVSINYRPDFSEGKWGFYQLDPSDTISFERMYSETSNGIFGTASSGKSGSITFSLSNSLEMKVKNRKDTTKADVKMPLLQSFDISGISYNLAADSMNWSNYFNLSARTTILKKINVTYSSQYKTYTVDSLGKELNKLELIENGRLGRFSNASVSLSGNIDQNTFLNEERKEERKKLNSETHYQDFDMPWSVNINYKLTYNKSTFNRTLHEFEANVVQTLTTGFTFKPTKNIRLGINTGYDIKAREFSYTQLNIFRDLHCWEMAFSAVPFGTLQNYSFRINVKSSIFEGLEYKREKRWTDNGY